MSILPRIDVTIRTPDLGLGGASVHVGIGGEDAAGRNNLVDANVDTAAAGLSAKVGLAGILNSDSPVDRLLHGPDALARFRTAAADPSPMATRGMTLRVGDIHAEIATRHDNGTARVPDAVVRADAAVRIGDAGLAARAAVGIDTRTVPVVRDAAATTTIPQRVEGAGGPTNISRGIEVGVALSRQPGSASVVSGGVTLGTTVVVGGTTGVVGGTTGVVGGPTTVGGGPTGIVGGPAAGLSLDGLVNVLDRAGTTVATPRDAPAGSVLVYKRADGGTVAELRTTAGFVGLVGASTLPLTGNPAARIGDGYTLVGVFVAARASAVGGAPFATAATPAFSVAATLNPTVAGAVVREPGVAPHAENVRPPAGQVDAAGRLQPGYANAMATSDLAGTNVRPDGSTIPAGIVVAQEDARPSFGEHDSDPASDRPYVHAIWYDILALRFAAAGIDLLDRSTVLRDVVWATAIEHGPFASADASDVLSKVQAALDLPTADDAAIIAAIFAERTRTTPDRDLFHFPEVLPFDRERVVARLNDEAQTALGRLAA